MRNIGLLLLPVILFSCSPIKTITTDNCDVSKLHEFSSLNISKYGIGILPPVVNGGKNEIKDNFGDVVSGYLKLKFGVLKVKSYREVVSALSTLKLTYEAQNELKNFINTNNIPDDTFRQLTDNLHVQYLLFARELTEGEVKKIYSNNSYYSSIIREEYFDCQLWDIENDEIVWRGRIGAAKVNSDKSDLTALISKRLTEIIGTEVNYNNCNAKKELIKEQRKQSNRFVWSVLGISVGLGVALGGIFVIVLA